MFENKYYWHTYATEVKDQTGDQAQNKNAVQLTEH